MAKDKTVYQVRWRVQEDGDGKWIVRRPQAKKPSRVFYESNYEDRDITARSRAKLEARRLAKNNCPAEIDMEGERTKVC